MVWRLSSIVESLLIRPTEEKHASTAVLFDDDCDHHDSDDDDDDDQPTWLLTAQTCRGVLPLAFLAFMLAP